MSDAALYILIQSFTTTAPAEKPTITSQGRPIRLNNKLLKVWFQALSTHVKETVRQFVLSMVEKPASLQTNTSEERTHPVDFENDLLPAQPSVFDLDVYLTAEFGSVAEFLANQPQVFKDLYVTVCGIRQLQAILSDLQVEHKTDDDGHLEWSIPLYKTYSNLMTQKNKLIPVKKQRYLLQRH